MSWPTTSFASGWRKRLFRLVVSRGVEIENGELRMENEEGAGNAALSASHSRRLLFFSILNSPFCIQSATPELPVIPGGSRA